MKNLLWLDIACYIRNISHRERREIVRGRIGAFGTLFVVGAFVFISLGDILYLVFWRAEPNWVAFAKTDSFLEQTVHYYDKNSIKKLMPLISLVFFDETYEVKLKSVGITREPIYRPAGRPTGYKIKMLDERDTYILKLSTRVFRRPGSILWMPVRGWESKLPDLIQEHLNETRCARSNGSRLVDKL